MTARWLWHRTPWGMGFNQDDSVQEVDFALPAPYNLQRIIFRGAFYSNQNIQAGTNLFIPFFGIWTVDIKVIHPTGATETIYHTLCPPVSMYAYRDVGGQPGVWANSWASSAMLQLDCESRISYSPEFGQVHVLLSVAQGTASAGVGGQGWGGGGQGQLDLLGSTTT